MSVRSPSATVASCSSACSRSMSLISTVPLSLRLTSLSKVQLVQFRLILQRQPYAVVGFPERQFRQPPRYILPPDCPRLNSLFQFPLYAFAFHSNLPFIQTPKDKKSCTRRCNPINTKKSFSPPAAYRRNLQSRSPSTGQPARLQSGKARFLSARKGTVFPLRHSLWPGLHSPPQPVPVE